MSGFGLTPGWQRHPWAKTGERLRRYIPWAKTGERRRRYIRWAGTGERRRRYIRWAGTGERRRRYIPWAKTGERLRRYIPWTGTGERRRRYIPWAKTGERRRRYIRLGWNGRTPMALHTLGLELANAEGVRNSGLTRLHTNFPLHQLPVTPTFPYTNSKRSAYCGTSTVQPKRSFMWAAIALAVWGSRWVKKVRRGGAFCIPASQCNTSFQSACAEKPPIFVTRQRTGTHCFKIFTSRPPSSMRRPIVPAAWYPTKTIVASGSGTNRNA